MIRSKKADYSKHAVAIGMARAGVGFVAKEELGFVLSENSRENKKIIERFAAKHGCDLVEVWKRKEDKWDELELYKVYTCYRKKEVSYKVVSLYN